MAQNTVDAGSSAHDVLRLLYEHGPQRQSQIAERLQVSVAACNRQFKKLADEKLIAGCADPVSRGGRPSQSWRIEAAGNYFLGIVFCDGVLAAMLIDFDSTPVWRKSCPVRPNDTRAKLRGKLLELAAAAAEYAAAAGGKILQSFVGIPGLMARDGMVLNTVNFPALNGLRPECELEAHIGVRCFCDSTHHAYILSETADLSPESTAMLIDWSDGFGVLVSSNRQALNWPAVYTRRRRGIWNLGHVRVEAGGALCRCGNRGCLEAYVGGLAMRERHPGLGCASDREMLRRALDGDPAVAKVLCDAARLIGRQLYWTIEIFGVDTIIVSGVYGGAFGVYADAFREGLAELHTPEEMLEITVGAGSDSEHSFTRGAALMARQFFFYPDEPLALRGLGRITAPPAPEPSQTGSRHAGQPS